MFSYVRLAQDRAPARIELPLWLYETGRGEELIDIMRIVRARVREIRDIWIADNLSAELTAGTFDFTYMTFEQVMELMAGHAALLTFFGTEITVAEGITVTPDTIISRTKPPTINWGITAPTE